MKFLLSVIAVCLVMITAKLYIPEANADISYNNQYELLSDYEFKKAVEKIALDVTREEFDEVTDVFFYIPNTMKEMIIKECSRWFISSMPSRRIKKFI
jgi:hypothetical protein